MNIIQELGQKLKADAMKNYDVRFPNPRFDDAMKTIHFFIHVYAMRGNMSTVEVPVRFMQHLCSLASDGFEAAAGYRYKHEKEALDDLLEKIWYHFAGTLMRWVEKQRKNGSIPRELWYSCFQVPSWLIEAAEEDYRRRKAVGLRPPP